MSTHTTDSRDIATRIIDDYCQIQFAESELFYWSARSNTVFYTPALLDSVVGIYKLLHETGHALLEHATFESAPELLSLEVAAWTKAKKLAGDYGITIDQDYIESCLDSYRDWLHRRSMCPTCKTVGTEIAANTYRCFNCSQKWLVSPDQRSRCYRQKT